jgi:hypothetical protein
MNRDAGVGRPAQPGAESGRVGQSPLARRAHLSAARRRAWMARRRGSAPARSVGERAGANSGPPAAAARSASGHLTPDEVEQGRARAAMALVRTIRSVPMPGVAPFSRRDLVLVGAVVALEALVVLFVAGGGAR